MTKLFNFLSSRNDFFNLSRISIFVLFVFFIFSLFFIVGNSKEIFEGFEISNPISGNVVSISSPAVNPVYKFTGFVVSEFVEEEVVLESFDNEIDLEVIESPKLGDEKVGENKNDRMEFVLSDSGYGSRKVRLYFDLLNYSEFVESVSLSDESGYGSGILLSEDNELLENVEESGYGSLESGYGFTGFFVKLFNSVISLTGRVVGVEVEEVEVNLSGIQEIVEDLSEDELEVVSDEAVVELDDDEFEVVVEDSVEDVEYKWGYNVMLKDLNFMAKIDVSSDEGVVVYDDSSLLIGNNLLSFGDLVDEGYVVRFDVPDLGMGVDGLAFEGVGNGSEVVEIEVNGSLVGVNVSEVVEIEVNESLVNVSEEVEVNESLVLDENVSLVEEIEIEDEEGLDEIDEDLVNEGKKEKKDKGEKSKEEKEEKDKGEKSKEEKEEKDTPAGVLSEGKEEKIKKVKDKEKVKEKESGYGVVEESLVLGFFGLIGRVVGIDGVVGVVVDEGVGEIVEDVLNGSLENVEVEDLEYGNKVVVYIERDFGKEGLLSEDNKTYEIGDVVFLDPTISILEFNVSSGANVTIENNFSHLSVSDVAPYDSLVLYMPFDVENKSDGTMYDWSGEENDGTIVNASWNASGAYGGAMDFDGDGDYVALATINAINYSRNNISFSGWFNTNNLTIDQFIFSQTVANQGRFGIFLQNDGDIMGYYYNDTSFQSSRYSVAISQTNQWYHFVYVWNTSGIGIMYINGVLGTNRGSSGDITSSTSGTYFGKLTSGINYFNGSIDEVMIFNTSLTAQQISDIYNNQSSRFKTPGTQELKQFNITAGNNTVNVSTDSFQKLFGSNLQLRLGEWDISRGYNDTEDGTGYTLDDGLVGYWHFDNLSGFGENAMHVYDFSGNGNNGTLRDGAFINSSGFYENAADFNSDNNNVKINDYLLNNSNQYAEYTLSAWINARTWGESGFGRIYDETYPGVNGISFFIRDTSDNVRAIHSGASDSAYESSANTLTLNTWHHVTAVYDGSRGWIYVDGVDETDDSSIDSPIAQIGANLGKTQLGIRNQGNDREFDGLIDEMMVYNRSLSADEIKELYIKGKANWDYTDYENATSDNATYTIDTVTTNILPEYKFSAGNSTNPFYSSILEAGMTFDFYTSEAPSDNPPTISLVSPSNATSSDTTSEYSFNATITDDINITNATLYIWFENGTLYNTTEWLGISETTEYQANSTVNLTIYENYTWNYLAFDNASQGSWNSTNWTIEYKEAVASTIDLEIIYPDDLLITQNVTQNEFFNVTVNVTCRDADCGLINVTLNPVSSRTYTLIEDSSSDFIVGVPPNNPAYYDGERYWVFYMDGTTLKALYGSNLNDMLDAGISISDIDNNGKAYSVVFGKNNGTKYAWALTVDTSENWIWWRWKLNSTGLVNETSDTFVKSPVAFGQGITLTPDFGDNIIEDLYVAIADASNVFSRHNNATNMSGDEPMKSVDVVTNYPEIHQVFPLSDGYLFLHINANPDESYEANKTSVGGTWSTPKDIEFTNILYPACGLSHTGSMDTVQLDNGEIYVTYITNESDCSGNITLKKRGNETGSGWTDISDNILLNGEEVWQVSLATDGKDIWFIYYKDDTGSKGNELYFKKYDVSNSSFWSEKVLATSQTNYDFDRLVTQHRSDNERIMVLWSENSSASNWDMRTAYISDRGMTLNITDSIPFYTNTSNPNITSFIKDESRIITWFVNATGVINEDYIFSVLAEKNEGIKNESSSWNVTIQSEDISDTTNPDINITIPSINNTNTTDINYDVNYTASDETALDTCWWQVNGGGVTMLADCSTNLTDETWAEGLNLVNVFVNDTSNNINSSNITFRLDTTAPFLNITIPTINGTNTTDTTYDINYTTIDSGVGLDTCWYSNDSLAVNTTLADCGTNITDVTWSEGLHRVIIWSNDTLNNVNVSEISFRLDTIAPDINFTSSSVLNGTTTANSSVEINVSIVDSALEEVKYNWNGTNFTLFNDSLVLMMNFDNVSSLGENSTHVVDVSGGGNNGSAKFNAVVNMSGGKYLGGFEFDGTGDYVNIGEVNEINGASGLTICSWINLDTLGTTDSADDGCIFSKNYNAGADVVFWYNVNADGSGDHTYSFHVGDADTANHRINGNNDIAVANTWQFVCGVMNGGSRYLYLDGKLDNSGSGASVTTVPSNTDLVRIGGWNETANFDLDGSIDELRIWNRSLSASEINQLYMSNLQKFDSENWLLYVNQSKNATAGLDDGDYTYFASAKDGSENENITEVRNLVIGVAADTTAPGINFTDESVLNGTSTANSSVEINVSIVELDLDEVKYNWAPNGVQGNGTNFTLFNDSLVLMMNFDNVSNLGENSTHVVDVSGGGNGNGTVVDAIWNATGKYGGGFEFDGDSGRIDVDESIDDGLTDAITVSSWIKYNFSTQNVPIVGTQGSQDGFVIRADLSVEGKLEWQIHNGSYINAVSSSTYNDDNWHHVVGTYNGSNIYLYVDGVEVGNDDASGDISKVTSYFTIGDYDVVGNVWNGSIDEVRIWNRSLSASEISQLYMSNLRKFDQSQWYLYVNQSKNATDGLDDGDYTYYASAKDSTGNENITEMRSLVIGAAGDATAPGINFTSESVLNGTLTSDSSVEINVSIVESSLDEVKYNWNGTNFTLF
ncbi:LamG domain-containing protein, partial [archaeon]|nr:LamG domain-containing protein [archaeon]